MLDFGSINWLAVVVGVIFTNVLGYLWFNQLFGNRYLSIKGMTRDEIEDPGGGQYAVTLVSSAVAMIALALVVNAFAPGSLVEGVIAGVVAWVLAAVATYAHGFFEGIKPGVWGLFAVYQLVSWAVMGAVFAVWTV